VSKQRQQSRSTNPGEPARDTDAESDLIEQAQARESGEQTAAAGCCVQGWVVAGPALAGLPGATWQWVGSGPGADDRSAVGCRGGVGTQRLAGQPPDDRRPPPATGPGARASGATAAQRTGPNATKPTATSPFARPAAAFFAFVRPAAGPASVPVQPNEDPARGAGIAHVDSGTKTPAQPGTALVPVEHPRDFFATPYEHRHPTSCNRPTGPGRTGTPAMPRWCPRAAGASCSGAPASSVVRVPD
jgi:hypothetical protein